MLERLNYGLSYRFVMEPHERLEKRLLEWASYRIYGVCIEYDAVTAGKKTYTISSDGMWLLSHCFENWTEMDTPRSQYTRYSCDACHRFSHTAPWRCPECRKMFCAACAPGHIHFARKEEERLTGRYCVSCHAREMRHDAFTRCTHCDNVYCPDCFLQHIGEESKQQHRGKAQVCAECGRLERTTRLTRCTTCQRLLCAVCFASHRHVVDEEIPFTAEDFTAFYARYQEFGRQWWSSTSTSTSGTYTNTQTRFIPANVRAALKLLGVPESDPTVKNITARHKQLAKEQHPDRGGDTQLMAKINNARDVALKWAKAGEQQKT